MLLVLLMVVLTSVALFGCDGNGNNNDGTDTDTNTTTDTSSSTDTDQQDPNHTHKLPAGPAEDVSSDYEMK